MNKIIVGVIFGVIITWLGFTYISYSNQGNRMEHALVAKHKGLEVIMSSGLQQISGVAQVPEMMRDDLKEVFTAAIAAREGVDGSKAIFKMVQEQNPNLDASLYREIQRVVQSTKQELQANQTAFLSQTAQYEVALGNVWQGFWLRLAGYPKVDLSMLKVVTTGVAQEAFRTGIDPEIKLRK